MEMNDVLILEFYVEFFWSWCLPSFTNNNILDIFVDNLPHVASWYFKTHNNWCFMNTFASDDNVAQIDIVTTILRGNNIN